MIGIVLAGGNAVRMGGGDKGLLEVGGVPILDRVVATLRAQCDAIVISANGDATRFARFGFPVVPDDAAGAAAPRGPLGGILAALDAVSAQHPQAIHAVAVPTDTPFLPRDLVARLDAARADADAALVQARSNGRTHPVVSLWSVALRAALRRALDEDGLRKVHAFFADQSAATADWPAMPYDPFLNINTPDDLAAAEAIARALVREDRLAVAPPVRL